MKIRVALLALFVGCCGGLLAKSPETVIKVVVSNEFDKPVPNAEVILDFLGSRDIVKAGRRKRIHWEVRTNQEGRAHFPPVPEGAVRLQVNSKTYQTYGQKIDVTGEEKLVEITLSRPGKQYSAHPPLKPVDDPPKK
jgi:hypothetical protein